MIGNQQIQYMYVSIFQQITSIEDGPSGVPTVKLFILTMDDIKCKLPKDNMNTNLLC